VLGSDCLGKSGVAKGLQHRLPAMSVGKIVNTYAESDSVLARNPPLPFSPGQITRSRQYLAGYACRVTLTAKNRSRSAVPIDQQAVGAGQFQKIDPNRGL
jgi:hypothetical protein